MTRKIACGFVLFAASASLMAQGGSTYIKLKVNPGRAGVFLDGKYLGPAANFRVARKYAVPPGKHELKLTEPRYQEITKTVDVAPGKTTVISEAMKPLPVPTGPFGRLRIEAPDKFAAVYLNDKFYGHAGEFNNRVQGVLLPAGEYEVRVEPTAGGSPIKQKVQIQADRTAIVK